MIGFADFLKAIHDDADRDPYPWQIRFAERCASGTPPALVGIPTGCGKTTTIDALVWALACQADRPPQARTVGVRIVWAIDRRILVDEVHDHASRLAKRLRRATEAPEDPLHEAATSLASLSGCDPLIATRWRGGLGERPVFHAPAQAEVITSTVAQVGSRLLFRGYGTGRGSLSLAAGLVGCDTTICLDEAHLAEPFRQTVDAVRAHRRRAETRLRLPGLALVTLTATPRADGDDAIRLNDEDRAVLKRRLEAPKWARLADTPATETERLKVLAEATTSHLGEDEVRTVACVLNTVKRARGLFDLLTQSLGDEVDVVLLVGPQRPADRELLLHRHGDALFGRSRVERRLVCVATQTFEVGLDADVDAVVTDSASAAALIQRFGRLNRGGHRIGRATIVRDEGSWLYQADEPQAWSWLQSRLAADGTLDVSVAALDADESRPPPSSGHSAPQLTPAVIELLAQTNPRPGTWQEPSIEPFLRGADDTGTLDVAVCWRADLYPHAEGNGAVGYREMLLKLVPPQPAELLTISVRAARALLAARFPGEERPAKAQGLALNEADLEGGVEPAGGVPDAGVGAHSMPAPFIVIRRGEIVHGTLSSGAARNGDDVGRVHARGLAPGDVLVLPVEAGGVDSHGLAPASSIGIDADVAGDRRPRRGDPETEAPIPAPVRISPGALGVGRYTREGALRWRDIRRKCAAAERNVESRTRADEPQELKKLLLALRHALPDHPGLAHLASATPRWRLLLRSIGPTDDEGVPSLDEEELDALEGEGEPAADDDSNGPEPEALQRTWVLLTVAATERERRGGTTAAPPTLDAHARAVERQVDKFSATLRLPDEIRATLSVAAQVHDHGKADRRIQRFFHGGIAPFGGEPIAKSVFGTDNPRAARTARALSGLPDALRHEALSATVLADHLARTSDACAGLDPDLLLHIVCAHHGIGRPIPQPPRGGAPAYPFVVEAAGIAGAASGDEQDAWANGEWLERFGRVHERYGAWGVSYLEAIFMLADRTVSARGE